MDFGTLIFTKPERALTDVKFAEDRGFSHAWFPDSHMIWGDPFVCMALAATNTRTIKLGTGVAVASSRIAPVTVHSIATINQLAPGRVILGFGTGHTGRRVMGLPPVKQAEFREQVRLIHDLLRDGEGLYNTEGLSRKIRFLHRDRRFIDLDDKIPFYVAANGPKSLALAGVYGDGVLTTGIVDADRMAAVRKSYRGGCGSGRAKRRQSPDRFDDAHMRAPPGRESRFTASEGDDRALGDGAFTCDCGRIRRHAISVARSVARFTRSTRSTLGI